MSWVFQGMARQGRLREEREGAELLTRSVLGTGRPLASRGARQGAPGLHIPAPSAPSTSQCSLGSEGTRPTSRHPTVKAARTSQDAGPSNVVS